MKIFCVERLSWDFVSYLGNSIKSIYFEGLEDIFFQKNITFGKMVWALEYAKSFK